MSLINIVMSHILGEVDKLKMVYLLHNNSDKDKDKDKQNESLCTKLNVEESLNFLWEK